MVLPEPLELDRAFKCMMLCYLCVRVLRGLLLNSQASALQSP